MLSVSFTIRAFRAEVMFQILPAFQWHALTIHFAPLPYQTYKNTVQIKDKGMYCPLPLLLTVLSSFIPDIVSSLQTTTYFISHLSKETWVYTQNVHKESCKKMGSELGNNTRNPSVSFCLTTSHATLIRQEETFYTLTSFSYTPKEVTWCPSRNMIMLPSMPCGEQSAFIWLTPTFHSQGNSDSNQRVKVEHLNEEYEFSHK